VQKRVVRKRPIEARKTAKMQLQPKNSNLRLEQEPPMLIVNLRKRTLKKRLSKKQTVHKIVPSLHFPPKTFKLERHQF